MDFNVETDRTFRYQHIYSLAEITAKSIEVDEPTEYSSIMYLVARASDRREYWFITKEDGWTIDHTWSSFKLIRS
jgi:hypothetical protein